MPDDSINHDELEAKKRERRQLWKGIAVSNALVAALVWLTPQYIELIESVLGRSWRGASGTGETSTFLFFGSLVIGYPILLGAVSTFFWRDLNWS